MYEEFISSFESKINEVKLACLLSLIGRRLPSEQAISLYSRVMNGKTKLGKDALICLSMDTAMSQLALGQVTEAKQRVEAAASAVSDEAAVHSKIHQASLEYHRASGGQASFYHAALMFLTFTAVEDIPLVYKRQLAQDMAIAALTGDGIYNFGEVLATPILGFLVDQPMAWLAPLVAAVNRGAVAECRALMARHADALRATALGSRQAVVMEKASLLAIVNVAFVRSAADRQISFQELSEVTEVQADGIERLIMRAMSLGLIKGSLDEVDGLLLVTWVQPRVLDKAQLSDVSKQLGLWVDRVKTALVTVEDQAIELYS